MHVAIVWNCVHVPPQAVLRVVSAARRVRQVCAERRAGTAGCVRPKTTLLSLYAGDCRMRRVERDSQVLLAVLAFAVAAAVAALCVLLWGGARLSGLL